MQPSDSFAAVSGEHPLSPAARGSLVIAAAATIVLFYAASVASLALLALLIAALFLATLGAARFGLGAPVGRKIALPARMFGIFARNLWLPTDPVYRLPLEREDAPRLFDMVDDLARRTGVPAPNHISIEMNCGAWVMLGGFARGSGKTSLGVGYDLLAGLTTQEVESVFAHEMSHARLVQRGFSRWLNKGLARLARTTGELSICAADRRTMGTPSGMANDVEKGFDRLTARAARLVATYSRQDEFDADRGALELCGPAAIRSALTKLDRLDRVVGRLPWNERLARLQSGEHFGQWLVDEIETMTAAEDGEIARHAIDPYSTHPSLHDRLGMLPPETAPHGESGPGIDLLDDPDGIAMRLATEIERVVLAQEEKHTKALARKTNQLSKVRGFRRSRAAAFVFLALGIWLFRIGTANGLAPDILTMSVMMLVAGVVFLRVGSYRDRISLPVPAYGTLTSRTPHWETPEQYMAAEEAAATDIQHAAGEIGTRRDRIAWLINAAYAALAESDYLRAHIAARLALTIDGKSIPAALAYLVAAAGRGVGALHVERLERRGLSRAAVWARAECRDVRCVARAHAGESRQAAEHDAERRSRLLAGPEQCPLRTAARRLLPAGWPRARRGSANGAAPRMGASRRARGAARVCLRSDRGGNSPANDRRCDAGWRAIVQHGEGPLGGRAAGAAACPAGATGVQCVVR